MKKIVFFLFTIYLSAFYFSFAQYQCSVKTKTWSYQYSDKCKVGSDFATLEIQLQYQYPVFNVENQVSKKILKTLYSTENQTQIKSVFQKQVLDFISRWSSDCENNTDTDPFYLSYTFRITDTIIYNKNCILSIARHSYSFTGGVHGYFSNEYFNFDLKTGDTLSYKDVFLVSRKQLIDMLLKRYVRNQTDPNSLYEGWEEDLKNFKFAFYSDGMLFIFQDFYSFPPMIQSVFIKYDKLQPFLTEKMQKYLNL